MKRLKRIMALVIAMAMVVAMGTAVFAAEGKPTDTSISVSGLEDDDTVNFYKVLQYDETATATGGWVAAPGFTGLTTAQIQKMLGLDTNGKPVDKTATGYDPDAWGIDATLAGTISQMAQAAGVTAKFQNVGVTDGVATQATTAVGDAGLYVALVTPGTTDHLYNPVFVAADYTTGGSNTQEAVTTLSYSPEAMAKKEDVTLTKEVTGPTTNGSDTPGSTGGNTKYDLDLGDTVDFTISSKVPAYSSAYQNPTYVISDTTESGLEIQGTPVVSMAGLTGANALTSSDYTVAVAADKLSFTVTMNPSGLTKVANTGTAQAITVTYSAKIVSLGVDDKTTTFSVGPHKLKMFYIERGGCDSNLSVRFNLPLIIGRGNMRIAKKSMETDNANPDSYLPGAVFGIWEDPNCVGDPYTVATSDRYGIIFKNLPIREEGQKYYLKEISPPEGYLLDSTIYTMTAAGKDSNGEYTFEISNNGSLISDTDSTYGYPIIRNRLHQPISIGVHKTWQSADGTTIAPESLPADLTAKFVVKRFRTYSTDPYLTVNLKSDAAGAVPFATISAYAGDVLTICYEHAPGGTTAYGTANGQRVLTLPTNSDGSEISVNYTVNVRHAVNDVIDIVIPQSFLNDCNGSNYQGKNPEFDNIQLAEHHTVREQDTVYNNNESSHEIVLPTAGNWSGSLNNLTVQEKINGVVYHYEYYVVEKEIPEGFEAIFLDSNGNPLTNPASQAATENNIQEVINRELLDVPVEKKWADFSGEVYTWEATFQLDHMEVKVNSGDPDAPDALTTDFVPIAGKVQFERVTGQ